MSEFPNNGFMNLLTGSMTPEQFQQYQQEQQQAFFRWQQSQILNRDLDNLQQNPPSFHSESSQTLTQPQQVDSPKKGGRKKTKARRGKNVEDEPQEPVAAGRWLPVEEELLATCYVAVSEDNNVGREKQTNPQGSARTTSAVDLKEFYEKHYEKLLPIMADKYEYEQRKKEKLEEVKARLDFGEAQKKSTRVQESVYFESRTMSPRRQRRSRSPRHNPSIFTRLRRKRSRSPRHEYKSKARKESTMFKRLRSRGRSTFVHSDSRQESSRYTESHSKSEDSEGWHWKSKSRRKKSSVEDDDLSQPWVCAETDPFTSRIRHFDFPKTRMPSHVTTYTEKLRLKNTLKIFQGTVKSERWPMPTLFFLCHNVSIHNSPGRSMMRFDELPPPCPESIDI
ncbi:hypothetical protein Tco_0910975 [Tanacetum coccineum]|uniref:Uncharacterized protein n=1 Tax=Tanacetum coccineum TaxID=301880 RepID=A0ABQ5CVI9_9ASTR